MVFFVQLSYFLFVLLLDLADPLIEDLLDLLRGLFGGGVHLLGFREALAELVF
jgi:hypothetical protein